MVNDIPELDLDDGDSGEEGNRVRSRVVVVPVWGVALVAIGASVVAASLTHSWDDARDRRAQRETVAVIVSVPADADMSGSGDGETYIFDSTLQVINTGPLPIELGRIAAASGHITVHGDGGQKVVRPSSVQKVSVDMALRCSTWSRSEPIEVRVGVRTADGRQRSVTTQVDVHGTLWDGLPNC